MCLIRHYFFENVTLWLNEEIDMVGSELMDSMELVKLEILKTFTYLLMKR